MTVSIEGLDKVEVLRALYARSRPLGMGALQFKSGPLSRTDAEQEMAKGHYFDYVKGRVMKVSLKGDEFDPWLYDRDNGPGAAAAAVATLRQESAA